MTENNDLNKEVQQNKTDEAEPKRNTEPVNDLSNKEAESQDTPETDESESKDQTYQKLVRLVSITKQMKLSSSKAEMYEQIAKQFSELSGYQASEDYAEKCTQLAKKTKKELKKSTYEEALDKKEHAKTAEDYRAAALHFKKISGYLDADEQADQCERHFSTLDRKAVRKRLAGFALIVVCFIILFVGANTSHAKYYTANSFMLVKSYNSAAKIYKKLGDYKDSIKRLHECEYKIGTDLKEDGDYTGAAQAFMTAGNYKDSPEQLVNAEKLLIKNSKIGDLINIGIYQWEILDIVNNQAFMMLKIALPGMPYNNSLTDVTWETSSIRQWLNSEFLNKSFSEAERKNIILSNVANNENKMYGTAGGNVTQDYIFLMSSEEAEKYNPVFPTFKSNCWLRSPGSVASSAAFLSVDKAVMYYGYAVDNDKMNIRPVMWFRLE